MNKNDVKIFEENCEYLGLKYLQKEYSWFIEQAGKSGSGYWEFLCHIITQEANH